MSGSRGTVAVGSCTNPLGCSRVVAADLLSMVGGPLALHSSTCPPHAAIHDTCSRVERLPQPNTLETRHPAYELSNHRSSEIAKRYTSRPKPRRPPRYFGWHTFSCLWPCISQLSREGYIARYTMPTQCRGRQTGRFEIVVKENLSYSFPDFPAPLRFSVRALENRAQCVACFLTHHPSLSLRLPVWPLFSRYASGLRRTESIFRPVASSPTRYRPSEFGSVPA
jgi:hypothetical protein